MRNLYDFADNQLNWRSCRNFNMDNQIIAENQFSGADDEEDWFFPQPKAESKEDPRSKYLRESDPALPPIVYLSGMNLQCESFEKVPVNIAEFDCWDDLVEAYRLNLYISVVDADNCDFELARDVFDSEEIFDELVDNYRACL